MTLGVKAGYKHLNNSNDGCVKLSHNKVVSTSTVLPFYFSQVEEKRVMKDPIPADFNT